MGLDTRFVSHSVEFLKQLDEWAPTHIALDLIMPQMDGVQVLHLLAERDCQSMIILTSGIGSRVLDAAQRSAEEYSLNIAGVLPKPFNPAILRELLGKRPLTSVRKPAPAQAGAAEGEISDTDFRQALDLRELELAYQPKIACATGRVAGFEALGALAAPDWRIGHA